jgi:F-box interacting protein
MNPVIRKLITLPLGTLCNYHKESYGFALNHVTGDYKLVHLFRDEFEYVTCETLDLATRSWRAVNGPSFGLFNWFGHAPVSAIGALHWIPQLDNSDFIVSMEVENERFHCIPLPHRCTTHDRVMEMGGLLCFVTHEDLNIDIWNLKSVPEGIWTKQYSITKGSLIDMVPLFSLRISGDVIFRRKEDGSFHAYDFKSEVMREFEMDKERNLSSGAYLPHVNSLLSWTPSHHVSD